MPKQAPPATKTCFALLMALGGLCIALPAHAQWKWRDADGHVQFSDRPPPASVPDKDILQQPSQSTRVVVQNLNDARAAAASAASAAAAAASSANAAKADADKKAKEKKEADDAQRKKDEERARQAAIKADTCSRAQNQLRLIDEGTRIVTTNAQGERIYLDDAQRQSERQHAQDLIGSNCQ
ncbi:MAG: DUF4124 domain-containing protein [Burkholderiaceae bacterium]|nr:DUF4124 domain-containing protein [Roseateles sp.]MBV8470915.1 DUF4124 domain-containing protein [Burkholderiaceae bacterium]